ncbi:MAG: hydrogenase maturation nickel metallochaperone HypA [Erysipelotrichaceae bacterium]|jgi:hydrogenase nickel incorporation protein HypA/HybF|nr:hydrogenase maturation nickel metallochaperone HypA [Erysipelotrichaceae bacterium]
MHELGIVVHTIDAVEEVAKKNAVKEVTKITLEVGEVSGVVPEYFRDCFEWAKKKTEHLQNCVLDLVVLEAITYCRDCDSTYPTVKYGRECPHCHSGNTYLVTGQEINIRDIEVKQEEPPSE